MFSVAFDNLKIVDIKRQLVHFILRPLLIPDKLDMLTESRDGRMSVYWRRGWGVINTNMRQLV